MIPQHRQWLTRSYAVALTFLEIRVILGITGLDQPPDPAIAEIVVWGCVAVSVLVGDLANQCTSFSRRDRALTEAPAEHRRHGAGGPQTV